MAPRVRRIHEAQNVGHRVDSVETDRRILWSGAILVLILAAWRLIAQLSSRIESDDRVEGLVASLDDPALADLAVKCGVMLAVLVSASFQTIYLFLCAAVDERVLPGTMLSTRDVPAPDGRRSGLGPAVLVGLGATVPVHLCALVLSLSSPKDSPALYVWLLVLVALLSAWSYRRFADRSRERRTGALILLVLSTVAALSLLF